MKVLLAQQVYEKSLLVKTADIHVCDTCNVQCDCYIQCQC